MTSGTFEAEMTPACSAPSASDALGAKASEAEKDIRDCYSPPIPQTPLLDAAPTGVPSTASPSNTPPALPEEITYTKPPIHSNYTWIYSQAFYHIKVPINSIRQYRRYRKNVVGGIIDLKWDTDLSLTRSSFHPDQPLVLMPGQPVPDPRSGSRQHQAPVEDTGEDQRAANPQRRNQRRNRRRRHRRNSNPY